MRSEKNSIVAEIQGQTIASSFVFLVDYHGLKVEQLRELRAQLRKSGAQFHVVKNRLFKRVAAGRGWEKLDAHLKGPSGMVVGGEVTEVAKTLKKFVADNKSLPTVKSGMVGVIYLSRADIDELAQLPGIDGMRGVLVGVVAAPLARLVGVMKQKVSSLVYVLKAIEEKKRV